MDPFTWSLINMLLLVLLIVLVAVFLARRENSYRQQLLDKMDHLIELMENQNHK